MSETSDSPSASSAAPPKPDVRQQLAADRTLLAWFRTAIALAALGFVVARFDLIVRQAGSSIPSGHGARLLGVGLVVASVVVGLTGMYQYRQVNRMLDVHGDLSQSSRAPVIVGSLVILVVLVGLAVYLTATVK